MFPYIICKNIRNDQGYYEQIEAYFHKYSGVDFSHTICPKCLKTHYPKEYAQIVSEKKRTIQWRFRKIHLLKVEKLFDSQ